MTGSGNPNPPPFCGRAPHGARNRLLRLGPLDPQGRATLLAGPVAPLLGHVTEPIRPALAASDAFQSGTRGGAPRVPLWCLPNRVRAFDTRRVDQTKRIGAVKCPRNTPGSDAARLPPSHL